MRPCLTCQEPTEGTRCEACAPEQERQWSKAKPSPRKRGYDSVHDKLSKRARKAQPFCTDCGATEDLQLHHSAEAWRRHEQGKPPRLGDYLVVCGTCNRTRGDARTVIEADSNRAGNPVSAGHGPPGEGGIPVTVPDGNMYYGG